MIVIGEGHESLLHARRKRRRRGSTEHTLYTRHRRRAAGVHGAAQTQHGLRRAARRGLWNVAIRVYLTAAVMNLQRLAAFGRALRASAGHKGGAPPSGAASAFAVPASSPRPLGLAAESLKTHVLQQPRSP